ncbi:bifunctional lysylphosphatidylglycerol flippase/synthetase MprF [Pseudooceanicola sp. HF7]|uniref:bifunctional lysylphosphatidylglycerol flippase/synthetase MprF n=1 Tax=Pseudooceanicola sp. HF7 TaxID=2721560 RepID=UPI0034C5DB6E
MKTSGIAERLKVIFPFLLTAVLFAAGGLALYHLLEEVSLREVMTTLRATPASAIALAILCTVAGYGALVGFDWSALRYLGRRLPLPVVATGGFLGYAIENTVGAGPVTGGAVRYRIYSALGLPPIEIAAISVFGSIAFGAGTGFIGLAALAWHPHVLGDMLPHGLALSHGAIRLGALAALAAGSVALVVLALRGGELTFRGMKLRAPSPGLLAGQFLLTAAETLFSGLALYLLLPTDGLGFVPFMAVFAAAVLAGVASHVPGGVGVFESVVIAGLPPSVPAGQAAAALLLFRLIYYVLPFILALLLMALAELRMTGGPVRARLSPLFRAVSSLVPLAMAGMVFVAGALMMLGSLLPATSGWSQELGQLVPLAFLEGGALMSSVLGALLLVIAHGLMRRVEGAWWLAMAVLLLGAGASLANGLDYDSALALALAALILLPTRREFYRATRLTRNVLSLRWSLLMLCLGLTLLAVFFFAHKATPYDAELWWQFASDSAAPRALRAALVGLVVIALLLLRFALRPGRLEAALPDADQLARAEAILRAGPAPQGVLALTGDKALLFSPSGESFLMYRTQGRSWVALHEPIGREEEIAPLAWAFHDAAHAANARPVFYAVSGASAPIWLDMGLGIQKLGEEAVVELEDFGLQGSARKRLRTSHNRALRDGLSFEYLAPPHAPALLAELKAISDGWLRARSTGEKGFSVGAFTEDYLQRTPVALVRLEGRVVAFANLWETDLRRRAALDLMRHPEDAPSGVMEFLFTELLLHYRDAGFREFSLGNAPFSGLEARRGARLSTQLGAFLYRHGGSFYNFEGLRAFKEKFDPRWDPVYVALPPRANLVAVVTDLVALIGGGVTRSLGVGAGRR